MGCASPHVLRMCSGCAPDVLQACSQPHTSSCHIHTPHRRDSSHIFCICSELPTRRAAARTDLHRKSWRSCTRSADHGSSGSSRPAMQRASSTAAGLGSTVSVECSDSSYIGRVLILDGERVTLPGTFAAINSDRCTQTDPGVSKLHPGPACTRICTGMYLSTNMKPARASKSPLTPLPVTRDRIATRNA